MDGRGSDQLLRYLPAVDQEAYKSRMQSNCDVPKYYWIFRDMGFEQWRSTNTGGVKVLWLSGPAECQISAASSRIVDLAKETYAGVRHLVLYFFCSTAPTGVPVTVTFANTIVHQLARCSPQLREKVVSTFLKTLVDKILGKQSYSEPERFPLNADDPMEVVMKKVLELSPSDNENPVV